MTESNRLSAETIETVELPTSSGDLDLGEENQRGMTKELIIDGRSFQLDFEVNETTEELLKKLPLSLTMADLHHNEKYVYLSEPLSTAPEKVGRIEKGDVLLFGSDCLVIFYESFDTEYSYTRLGKIREADQLDFLANRETIQIELQ